METQHRPMGCIDHLPELGDPIRKERDRLQAAASHAVQLERQALAARAEVTHGEAALLARIERLWSPHDIDRARLQWRANCVFQPIVDGISG